jgi:hypothetical protein
LEWAIPFPFALGEKDLLRAWWKSIGDSIFRAISAATPTVPALIRIEDYRFFGFFIHMDYISRADLITDSAPGALVEVYDCWHPITS